ncbi:MAG TPA: electron transfer flavoprotein subunit alpha/FixB family protein [Candidatus Dormibacteraeota bacterium]|jgi:electron transfer flavoprotein alpha subunit|nr:electron transfer flavoprotein subunit alpha/FixB family protein [Candidatus Dormibacteraeota bacterium]
MAGKIWVLTEVLEGNVVPVGLELLTKARSMGGTVEALVFSPEADKVTATLGEYGATTVYAASDPAYNEVLLGGPAADAIAELAAQQSPDVILIGATYTGRDIAGRLAVKLDAPIIANGLDVSANGDISVQTAIFGATQVVDTKFEGGKTGIAVIRAKSFAAEPGGGAAPTVVPITTPVSDQHRKARVKERVVAKSEGPTLEDAPIVISGGRGLQDPSNFDLLQQVAQLVGGAVGASRAVVDAGWVPYAMQVGQTGKTVKPTVYIACGISGAMQHTVGMKGAKNIVAINKDAEAPIFKLADLGVVGDVLKILPQLIEALKAKKG